MKPVAARVCLRGGDGDGGDCGGGGDGGDWLTGRARYHAWRASGGGVGIAENLAIVRELV